MKFRSPALSLGAQVLNMQQDFPEFTYRRESNIPTWFGHLQPFEESSRYSIKISYRFDNRFSKRPRVWVISPQLAPNPPHVYSSDGSLCLYYPNDQTWNSFKAISKVIVPITAAWLGFYEIWLSTRVWYGPEAPHAENKG